MHGAAKTSRAADGFQISSSGRFRRADKQEEGRNRQTKARDLTCGNCPRALCRCAGLGYLCTVVVVDLTTRSSRQGRTQTALNKPRRRAHFYPQAVGMGGHPRLRFGIATR